jgi:hypothetical protein
MLMATTSRSLRRGKRLLRGKRAGRWLAGLYQSLSVNRRFPAIECILDVSMLDKLNNNDQFQ